MAGMGCMALGACVWALTAPQGSTSSGLYTTAATTGTTAAPLAIPVARPQLAAGRTAAPTTILQRGAPIPHAALPRPLWSGEEPQPAHAQWSGLLAVGLLSAAGGLMGAFWNARRLPAAEPQQWAMAATTGELRNGVPTGPIWEVDFCSRPLVDARGKRVWEIVMCNPSRTFEYTAYIPNNRVNSATLKAAVEEVLALKGAERPKTIRFFRGQMTTIITKAFRELNFKVIPSRRCFTIMNMIEERMVEVYQKDERFDANISLSGALRGPVEGPPKRLPDALRGQGWDFVQLPLSMVLKECGDIGSGVFGDSFDVIQAGCGDLSPDTLIPGVVVFSSRSKPLAAWTDSLELAAVTVNEPLACLVLETGFNDKWYYGGWTEPQLAVEGRAWEEAKLATKGLHFLALQTDEDAEVTDGFWLLMKREAPSV